jgi:phosphatidylserine/phosphatidylglycerophosphate/cardiolipin synthase-like enzyme
VVEEVNMEIDLGRAESISPQEKINNNKTTYEVIVGPEAILNDLKSEIRTAKSSLDLLFFVFEGDVTGKDIAMNLSAAASSGINTRLLVDRFIDFYHNDRCIPTSIFNRKLHGQLIKDKKETHETFDYLQSQGVDVKLMNPLGVFYNKLFNRDHRKLVVKDGNEGEGVAYLGSLDICDHETHWQNLMVKMKGEVVPILQKEFDSAWKDKGQPQKISFNDGFVITDTKGTSLIISEAEKNINNAKNKIMLESPYLWGKKMEKALAKAARRGVDVSIILPFDNNHDGHIFIPNKEMLKKFISSGVRIFVFVEKEGMTHSKVLTTDDVSMFGSSNFNEFTAGKNTETTIMSTDPKLVSQLESILMTDIAKSNELHILL